MTNIRPDVAEEEPSNKPESADEIQPENAPNQRDTEDQDGMVTGPVIINR